LSWLYGSGFPKSLDIGKAIDKVNGETDRLHRFTAWMRGQSMTTATIWQALMPFAKNEATAKAMAQHYVSAGQQPAIPTLAIWSVVRQLCGDVPEWVDQLVERHEAEREVVGERSVPKGHSFASDRYGNTSDSVAYNDTRPATDAAKQWDGWGTALKPAYEPIVLARKPLQPQVEIAILVPTLQGELCKVDSFAKTDTRLSELLSIGGFLSIVGLLNNTLDGLSEHASRFTTATAYALTTDLKILKSSLSRITQSYTTRDSSETSGVESDVLLAASISRSVLAKCERLASTIAGENAIELFAELNDGPAEGHLAPNWEPIVLARKPLVGTVAANVTQYGTGGINVNATRIGGRWPANVCLDEDAAALLDAQSGQRGGGFGVRGRGGKTYADGEGFANTLSEVGQTVGYGDSGGASRFFYTAKASRREREAGDVKNVHPTVKPIALMRWLCRLVTPPNGLVLDPFNGSGSTGCAAVLEGFRYLGAELDAEYVEIARKRIAHWATQTPEPDLFG
jgi:hypothetical protein